MYCLLLIVHAIASIFSIINIPCIWTSHVHVCGHNYDVHNTKTHEHSHNSYNSWMSYLRLSRQGPLSLSLRLRFYCSQRWPTLNHLSHTSCLRNPSQAWFTLPHTNQQRAAPGPLLTTPSRAKVPLQMKMMKQKEIPITRIGMSKCTVGVPQSLIP